MYKIISIYNQSLIENIKTLSQAKKILKEITLPTALYRKEELKIIKDKEN